MLVWDSATVAALLGTQAVLEANSSYTFSFQTIGGPATLQVFPYTGEVLINIGEDVWASWRLNCSAIVVNTSDESEFEDSLAFIPADCSANHTSHWVVLTRSRTGFEILTVFRGHDGRG